MKRTINNNKKIYNKECILTALLLLFCSGVLLTACGNKRVIDENSLPEITDVVSISGMSISGMNVSDDSISENDDVSSEDVEEGLLDSRQRDNLTAQFQYINDAVSADNPSAMTGFITEGYGRDIFFANGTEITIYEPNADMTDYVHDEQIQADLGNGLGPDNRGYGGVATWKEGSTNKYVVLSNMAEVFGGSYKQNLKSDVNIILDGSVSRSAYPNISFLFGGSLGGDVIGNINIKVSDALPMYVYGGSCNGGVYGDVNIDYDGEGWSMEIVGGGLAMSAGGNVASCVYGDIKMNLASSSSSKIDSIIGGGLSLTDTNYLAISDVHGDIDMSVSGESVYEICGGGMACKMNKDSGTVMSNVYGNINVFIDDTNILLNDKSTPVKSGLITGGCMTDGGIGLVSGNTKITLGKVKFANRTAGVYAGGFSNRELGASRANVYGECSYDVTDEKYEYDYLESNSTIKTSDSIMNYFNNLFAEVQEEYSEQLKEEFAGQQMEDVINVPNVPVLKSIYEEIFSSIASGEFDNSFRNEMAYNMKDVSDFSTEKKKSIYKIYYPNPTSCYMWSGDM